MATESTRSAPLVGLLNLKKPTGLTSRDVVNRVTRLIRKVKAGHAGTLDPLASGVLVVCVGSATRLIEYVQDASKTYRTVIRLGATSDTLDSDGMIVENLNAPRPSLAEVEAVLPSQVGTLLQVPPQFSALKVAGKRAYDLARAGQVVELAARRVEVHRIELLSYDWPHLALEIDCGSGTYIRSIARDIGEALGCGGLMAELVRTRIGPFTIDNAVDPAELKDVADLRSRLIPSVEALGAMPRFVVDSEQQANLLQGRSIRLEGLPKGEVALVSASGTLVAIAEAQPLTQTAAPRRVLVGD